MAREKKKRCVECGHKAKSLFIQYSPGNFRLMKCENCEEVADEYVECELMIIFIDLILHKTKAYRHLLYNVVNQETANVKHLLWKLVLAYLLLDTYRSLLFRRTNDESNVSMSFVLVSLKVLVNVLSANFAFVLSFALAAKMMLVMSIGASRGKEILLGILISSYVKIFLFAMPVWEFPVSVIFIVDMLVLTSNAVALEVMTESATSRCLAVCFIAYSIKFLVDQISVSMSLKQFGSIMIRVLVLFFQLSSITRLIYPRETNINASSYRALLLHVIEYNIQNVSTSVEEGYCCSLGFYSFSKLSSHLKVQLESSISTPGH